MEGYRHVFKFPAVVARTCNMTCDIAITDKITGTQNVLFNPNLCTTITFPSKVFVVINILPSIQTLLLKLLIVTAIMHM